MRTVKKKDTTPRIAYLVLAAKRRINLLKAILTDAIKGLGNQTGAGFRTEPSRPIIFGAGAGENNSAATYFCEIVKKLKLYIETSVWNFLFADDAPGACRA